MLQTTAGRLSRSTGMEAMVVATSPSTLVSNSARQSSSSTVLDRQVVGVDAGIVDQDAEVTGQGVGVGIVDVHPGHGQTAGGLGA